MTIEPIFHWRADYTTTGVPYRSQIGRAAGLNGFANATAASQIAYSTSTSFSNLVWQFDEASQTSSIIFPGFTNMPNNTGITLFWRIHTQWTTGVFGREQYLLSTPNGMATSSKDYWEIWIASATGKMRSTLLSGGSLKHNNLEWTDTIPAASTVDIAMEIYTDSTVCGYVNGSNVFNTNVSTIAASFYQNLHCMAIGGATNILSTSNQLAAYVEEFAIYDTSSALTHTTTSFGTNRTAYLSSTARDFGESSDPGVANVLSATGYTIQGESLTGTYNVGTSQYTDPGVANVLSGTSYLFADSTLTGTYHDASYTDPGIANVRSSTSYIFNDSTLTGTLSVPTAADGPANAVDIANIKTQIKFVLEQANTTTASPVDLSNGLNSRVKDVVCIRPDRIPMQPSILPLVNIYLEDKDILFEESTRASNQLRGKRTAELTFKVAGLLFENQIQSSDLDESDDQIERLMENIELTLRAYANLDGAVSWQFPEQVQYFVGPDEETLYRVGFMDLIVRVHY